MHKERIFEYAFFFLLLTCFGYLSWKVLSPFIAAIVLAAIIVTISYPLYEQVRKRIFRNNATLASAVSTLIVILAVVIPSFFIFSLFAKELIHFSKSLNTGREVVIESYSIYLQDGLKSYLPGYDLDIKKQIIQSTEGMIKSVGSILAGTFSTFFMIFISLIGSFYFFKDGKNILNVLVKISPLSEKKNKMILSEVTSAIRNIATGALLIAVINGFLATLSFTVAGIDRAIIWGMMAGLISIIPGVGTFVIIIPAVVYLFVIGKTIIAIGLLIWAAIAAIIVDNFIGPHLIGRGIRIHPFFILVSILGGVTVFGPIGFMLGPIIVTTFVSLLDIYKQYVLENATIEDK